MPPSQARFFSWDQRHSRPAYILATQSVKYPSESGTIYQSSAVLRKIDLRPQVSWQCSQLYISAVVSDSFCSQVVCSSSRLRCSDCFRPNACKNHRRVIFWGTVSLSRDSTSCTAAYRQYGSSVWCTTGMCMLCTSKGKPCRATALKPDCCQKKASGLDGVLFQTHLLGKRVYSSLLTTFLMLALARILSSILSQHYC